MKNLLLALAIMLLVSTFSCDLVDDSPCGEHRTFDLYLLGPAIVDTTTGVYYTYMDGTTRVFQWSNLVEEVCPEEHVKSEFRVALLDEDYNDISARGVVSWLFLFEDLFPMTKDGDEIKSSGETGLKQAFDTDPGWYVPALEVFFQTKGSYSADTAFLKDRVVSVEIMSKYRHLN